MERNDNPYHWQGDRPKHHVPRAELLATVVKRIGEGESGYLVGCRGMGKSVFLHELANALQQPDIDLLEFPMPPSPRTVAHAIQNVADKMVEACCRRGGAEDLIKRLERHARRQNLRNLFDVYVDAVSREKDVLVLLYDELDAYADPPELGRHFFSELEDIRKRSDRRVVIYAAGGLGLVALDTLYGSSFFSRLTPDILEPFGADDIARLAKPFETRGTALSPDVLDTLRLSTGGNVALTTYGLEQLWKIKTPSVRDVTAAFGNFRDKYAMRFLQTIRGPIFDAHVSDTPEQIWRKLFQSGGRMTELELRQLITRANSRPRLDEAQWIFMMLRSTGLIRASDDTYRRATIDVEIIPSILTIDIPDKPHVRTSLREQLAADLCDVLATIQRMALDFYRAGDKNEKQLVPESVFSAALVLGLEPRGWKVEREPQSAAGRTDIKARHGRFGEQWVVVELKIWGRNHATIHSQVTSYWAKDVEVLATVMITDRFQNDAEWCNQYIQTCLDGQGVPHQRKEPPPWLAGHFIGRAVNCRVEEVDHFLLRLPKRR